MLKARMTPEFENECDHCLAGHAAVAEMQKMGPAAISALRNGRERPDPRLEAPNRFRPLVVPDRGRVSDADGNELVAAGFAGKDVLHVILGVATKLMRNDTRHSAHGTLHPLMRGKARARPLRSAA